MGYRNLFIESPAELSIQNGQLKIRTTEQFTFPLDDLQSILIDDSAGFKIEVQHRLS